MRKPFAQSVAEALCDALTASMTLNARTGLAPAYSEYLLYSVVVQVCHYRGWVVRSEVRQPKAGKTSGDFKRIDFEISEPSPRKRKTFVELKYARSGKKAVGVLKDVKKLVGALSGGAATSQAIVLVAGAKARPKPGKVRDFTVSPDLGQALYRTTYLARSTTFGADAFEVSKSAKLASA
jgi:hypothetical protein